MTAVYADSVAPPRDHRPPRRSLHRSVSALVALVVILVVTALGFGLPSADAAAYRITHPVDPDYIDDVFWTDTWGAPRSGGRSHIGVDIMGDRMIPLVAANDSVVTWGEFDNAGGNIVRLRDDAGWEYQYIHINNDTPGTDDGQASCRQAFAAKICETLSGHRIQKGLRFEAGEFIGFLGDSGNAEWTAPHLHFEIYQPSGSGVTAVNPTPYTDAAAANPPPTSGGTESEIAAYELFTAANGRQPGTGESGHVVSGFEAGGQAGAIAALLEDNTEAAKVDRLYRTFFRRSPEGDGLNYWTQRRGNGHDLETIAEWFAESSEFQNRYGSGTFEDFLDQLYLDLLGREPLESGKEYWLDRLRRGEVNRGTIVVHFSEGEEAQRIYQYRTERAVLAHLLGTEPPTNAQLAEWVSLRADRNLAEAVAVVLDASS